MTERMPKSSVGPGDRAANVAAALLTCVLIGLAVASVLGAASSGRAGGPGKAVDLPAAAQGQPEAGTAIAGSAAPASTRAGKGPRKAFRSDVEPITLEEVRAAGLSEREALYWEKLPGGEVQCTLCARGCMIAEGARGHCRVRWNSGGALKTLVYGKPLSRAIDPIEKKPLFHFMPGSRILSIATAGCSLRCRFCQNWKISQAYPEDAPHIDWTPEQVVAAAVEHRCPSIAFTYTEPSVFYEYMLDTAKLARAKGIKTVWVTCGYLNEEPLVEFAKYLDGANVDLKGFSEKYYDEYCGARLQPVLDTLKVLRREGVYFEITNLVVPGGNDTPEMIRAMCEWITKELGPGTPLHFSRYHPDHLMDRPGPTPLSTLVRAREIARAAGIEHVYIGNVRGKGGEATVCPKCDVELIVRWGYLLEKNAVRGGACPRCKTPLPGVWE